jgi:hypothetical protein
MTYFVDRNVNNSRGGLTWEKAFKTIGEAVEQVNEDYDNSNGANPGRNREIVIGEGWYSETAITLTAHDVFMHGVGAGSLARTVLYGSLTQGGWDDGNLGPALSLTGQNCTIANMDFVNRSATISGVYSGGVAHTEHPCILEGTYTTPSAYNRFYGLGFMRDQVDAASWGIISYSMDHTWIQKCFFNGVSLKQGGVAFQSGTGTNHSLDKVEDCDFAGVPIGVWQNSSHNGIYRRNFFCDQGAVSSASNNPFWIAGGTAYMYDNHAPDNTLAELNGGGSGIQKRNLCSDSDENNTPADA